MYIYVCMEIYNIPLRHEDGNYMNDSMIWGLIIGNAECHAECPVEKIIFFDVIQTVARVQMVLPRTKCDSLHLYASLK